MSKHRILLSLLIGLSAPSVGIAQTCSHDLDCDDGNVCTDDTCVILPFPGGFCGYLPNTDPCDDGNICTSGDVCNAGTCAGTPIPDCCAISVALDGDRDRERTLQPFRSYRDIALGSTLEGRGLVALYYRHTEEVAEILDSAPALRLDAAVVLVRLAPVVWKAAAGQDAVLSKADVAAIDRLSALIQRQATDELANDLQILRDSLATGELPDVLGVRLELDRTRRR
jgi:hypothetical protein